MTVHQIHKTTDTATPSRRESAEVRHQREIVSLLGRHAELRGVHAMADFFDDAVRWTA